MEIIYIYISIFGLGTLRQKRLLKELLSWLNTIDNLSFNLDHNLGRI